MEMALGNETSREGNCELPSLKNPTRDFLQKNCTKVQLQKHLQDLGMKNVWTTKAELIDRLLEKHRESTMNNVVNDGNEPGVTPENLCAEISSLKDAMNSKNSEISELNEMLKKAHITINKLSDRLSALEDHIQRSDGNATRLNGGDNATPPQKTLLLGDTNLKDVISSDLGLNSFIRTIKGATTNLLRSWVSEKCNCSPENCVIYCSLQDLIDGVGTNDILDNVGALITELKGKQEHMKIYVCQVAPPLNEVQYGAEVSNYNVKLGEWCDANGVSVINTNLSFQLANGRVDDMCYELDGEYPGVFLNRYGVIRLLSAIDDNCDHFNVCENWDTVKRRQVHPANDVRTDVQSRPRTVPYRNVNSPSHQNVNRYSKPRYSTTNVRNTGVSSVDRRSPRSTPNFNNNNSSEAVRHSYSNYHQSRSSRFSSNNDGGGNIDNHGNVNQYQEGCFNCGEFNHSQSTCRYDHKLRCAACNSLGHKSKFCNNYAA